MIFDAHADIWTDVTAKRQHGMNDIIRNVHLGKFNNGGIYGGIFVIWIDPPYDKEPKKRMLEIIENMSVEITNNQDIIQIVKKYEDIEEAIRLDKLAVMIGIEGLSGIGENIDLINALYMFGARHASLTWNEENSLATGVNGDPKKGLTKYGVEAVKKLEKLGMIVDVSHLNEKSFWDITRVVTKPFIASHSNCKALCDVPRNLSNEQLRAVADSKGVVGLNAFADFVDKDISKRDIEHLVNHIDYMVDIMGIDHVGFGFDFCDYLEGDTMSSFAEGEDVGTKDFENAAKAQNIITILGNRGYSKQDIEKISYKNFHGIIKDILK